MGWFPGLGATSGADEYTGTSGNDGSSGTPIHGLDGNDTLSGLAGNDALSGDAGDDILNGGIGNDRLDGGDGNDTITDEDGNDHISGGGGDDIIIDRDAGSSTQVDNNPYIDAGSGNDLVQLDWKYQNNDTNPFLDGGDGIDTLDLSGSAQFGIAAIYLDIRNFETLYVHNFETYITVSQLEAFDTIRYSATDSTTPIEFDLFYTDTRDLDLSDELGSQSVIIHNKREEASGFIRTGAGNDEIYGNFYIERLYGGAGNDVIFAGGNDAGDTLYGEDGNDKLYGDPSGLLYGGSGNDQLFSSRIQYGEDGDDELKGNGSGLLYGGSGNDKLSLADSQYGEAGNDTLYVGSSPDGAIYDGGEDVDTLVLSTDTTNYDIDLRNASLHLIEKLWFGTDNATSAATARVHIYASQIGAGLSADASLQGYKDSLLLITMGGTSATNLSGFTFGGGVPKIRIDGDGDGETITGSLSTDYIFGNDGADVLAGGRGIDSLYGGAGDDTLQSNGLDGPARGEIYDGGDGSDTLLGTGPNYTVDFSDDTITNVEILKFSNPGPLGIGTIKVTADQIANIHTITGQAAFRTGDVLQIAMGTHSALFLLSSYGYVFTNFSGSDDYVVINGDGDGELVIGSVCKDTINGNGGDDTLDGSAGLDRLFGGDGDDYLSATAGEAVAGETYDGGAGTDILHVVGPSYTSYDVDFGADTIKSIEKLYFDDVSGTGGYGVLRFLAAQVGAGLSSTALIQGSLSSSTQVLAFTMGDAAALDLSQMTFTGFSTNDYVSITGDDDAETITGSAVNDAISAGGGNDTLVGGPGADALAGGMGNDTYVIDASDILTEYIGEGVDTVRADFSYTLGFNLDNLVLTGAGAIDGTGNTLDNVLTGNDQANVLRGLGGNDTYNVGAGDQVFENAGEGVDLVKSRVSWTLGDNIERLALSGSRDTFGSGNALANKIIGNAGDNRLDGRDGNDMLDGGAGDDVLTGGIGRDRLTGDAGKDSFVFDVAARNGNADTITDFTAGEDMLHLARAFFRAIGAQLDPGEFKIGATATDTVAGDANDFVLYNQASGQLYYDKDGSGAHAPVLIATLSSHPMLTSADFLVI